MIFCKQAGILWRMSKCRFLRSRAKGHGGISHRVFSTFRLTLPFVAVVAVLATAQAQAETISTPRGNVPTSNEELQVYMAGCATHMQHIINGLKISKSGEDEEFRSGMINALEVLTACRINEAEAMRLRNNAEIGAPSKYSEL